MKLVLEHARGDQAAPQEIAILCGDAEALDLEPCSVDSIVSDPPAAISFMGAAWDADRGGRDGWIQWLARQYAPSFRALKPGGHALIWALPRTSHWTAPALELAGFEIRDIVHDVLSLDDAVAAFAASLDDHQRQALARIIEGATPAAAIFYHAFGSGFPKSLDISKAIDATLGAEPTKVGERLGRLPGSVTAFAQDAWSQEARQARSIAVTVPATAAAATWAGWGTALKPAVEHWILARKPLDGTYAENILRHGVGGLNIDACRIGTDPAGGGGAFGSAWHDGSGLGKAYEPKPVVGRWPAHLVLDERGAAELDEQSGVVGCGNASDPPERARTTKTTALAMKPGARRAGREPGASRFFYCPKPSKRETEAGLDHLPKHSGGEATGREDDSAGVANPRAGANRGGGRANIHPTKKSVALMTWLVRLVTPPGGVVLDPFAGSGTTGIAAIRGGFSFVGVEQGGPCVACGECGESAHVGTDHAYDPKYLPILLGRIRHEIDECDARAQTATREKAKTECPTEAP